MATKLWVVSIHLLKPFENHKNKLIMVLLEQPQSSENCHWQYGVFPHATSCTRYWHCWNGTSTIQQCPFSLLYNDAIHACDWPDNVQDCQKHRKQLSILFCFSN